MLGQSFGGITLLTYLSSAPHGLRGGVHHRRRAGDRRPRRRDLRRDLGADRGAQPALHALSGRPQPDALTLAEADGVSIDRLRTLGNWLGMSDGFERVDHVLGLPPHSPPSGPTPTTRSSSSATRSTGCCTKLMGRQVRHELVGAADPPGAAAGVLHGRADPAVEVEGPLARPPRRSRGTRPRLFDEDVLSANTVPAPPPPTPRTSTSTSGSPSRR